MRQVSILNHTRWECEYHAQCLYRAVTPRIRPDPRSVYTEPSLQGSGLIAQTAKIFALQA